MACTENNNVNFTLEYGKIFYLGLRWTWGTKRLGKLFFKYEYDNSSHVRIKCVYVELKDATLCRYDYIIYQKCISSFPICVKI